MKQERVLIGEVSSFFNTLPQELLSLLCPPSGLTWRKSNKICIIATLDRENT
jgi:hypothetical protein